MTFLPTFLPCILPKFINKRRRRSLEAAMGLLYWDAQAMNALQEPCPRVPGTLTQPIQGREAQETQRCNLPGQGEATLVDEKGTGQAGMAISASHIHTSVLAFFTVHIWATHLTGRLHRPISPCSQGGKKRFNFPTKITHFTAKKIFFIYSLLDQFSCIHY